MGHCCSCSGQAEQGVRQYVFPSVALLMLLGGLLMRELEVEFFRQMEMVWYGVAYGLVGASVWREAWRNVRQGDIFNEFTLMVIATAGAFYIGEYPEGVAVMLFYTLGEMLQDRAVDKARRNIRLLMDVRPEMVTVADKKEWRVTAPEEVKIGEIIEVKAGERISLDGKLLSEGASFDTAALTGESIPRYIPFQGEVLAGMIATDQRVEIEVTRLYGQSALARILHLVEEAAERKAPAELFIRKFAKVYTPVVTGLALLVILLPFLYSLWMPAFTFVFKDWLYRALVFLVVSCPCALVVSIPLGYFGGIGAASRQGILFKGGNYLDAMAKVNTVVFDKTGTLTRGVFEVKEVCPEPSWSAEQLVQFMVSLEDQSNHPVAKAVCRYADAKGIGKIESSAVREWAGYGLTGRVKGREVWVGNVRLLRKYGIVYPSTLDQSVDTIVCCAVEGVYAGCLLLTDGLKEDAGKAVVELKRLNIPELYIFSGDPQAIVARWATVLGIKKGMGGLLPEDKVKQLEILKADSFRRIAFVGDGINDAPVLALSDVGIAMGGLGSDAAIEAADVVIQTDQPSKIAVAIRISKFTRRVIWQNISWAIGVKGVILLLGVAGIATLWEAVFADVGVALIAIFNVVRIGHVNFNSSPE